MPLTPVADRIAALSAAAADWREPDHPEREAAVDAALAAENRCTAEALAFTINQRMHTLTERALTAWAGEIPQAATPQAVALVDGGATPLATFHLWIALVLAGHNVHYRPSRAFPALLPAFADAVAGYLGVSTLSSSDDLQQLIHCNAVIVLYESVKNCKQLPTRTLGLRQGTSVAVVGDKPSSDTWENLAEDTLLYGGAGDTTPRLLFAPATLDPDAFLDACAHFRAIYPAHRDTPGRLKMQQAMLEALDVPHGYSNDLGFLVSKGEAEIQSPGHIRWVPYTSINDIAAELPPNLNLVVAPDGIAQEVGRVIPEIPIIRPGTAHRPPVDGHTSSDHLLDFLETLARPEAER